MASWWPDCPDERSRLRSGSCDDCSRAAKSHAVSVGHDYAHVVLAVPSVGDCSGGFMRVHSPSIAPKVEGGCCPAQKGATLICPNDSGDI